MIALILVLALQADPLIEKVERVAGDVHRPLLWTPLRVTLSSAAGFRGDVVARSEFGFETATLVQLAAGGRATILLPALDPREVVARQTVHKMTRDFVRPDRLVLVDSRLPYAAELTSTPQILYQKISGEDLQALRPRGLLEVADLILTRDNAATKEDAEQRIAGIGPRPERLEAVDRMIWPLAPRGGWVPAKKTWTVFFAVVYAFSSLVGLAVVARRFPKFGLVCVAAVAVLGMLGYAFIFPRRQVWVIGERVQDISPTGDAREHHVWFLNAAAAVETSVEFPQLVKPIFTGSGGADDPFTLRVEEKGCRVEGLKLGPQVACFGVTEAMAPVKVDLERSPASLRGTVLVRGGQARFLGDVAAGTPLPATIDVSDLSHRSPGYDGWSRFVGRDGLFGVEEGGLTVSQTLTCTDLADERERPRSRIQRLK